MIRVITAEFFEPIEMPHATRDMLPRIADDEKGRRFEVRYFPREAVILISPKDGKMDPRLVSVSNVKTFTIHRDDLSKLVDRGSQATKPAAK